MSYCGLNIKLFVINNGGYVSIRNTQDSVCEGRYIGSDASSGVQTLDLRKVADAFGLSYECIDRHEVIDEKLRKIFSGTGPCFVEVMCDHNQKIVNSLKKAVAS